MCQNHTVKVVVLDFFKQFTSLFRLEIILARIQNLGIGIRLAVCLCNLMYIRLESDNHRLACQSETFHLLCRHTHNHSLAGSDLMVTDTPTVLFEHPDGILL